jgi:hypothetical protein
MLVVETEGGELWGLWLTGYLKAELSFLALHDLD